MKTKTRVKRNVAKAVKLAVGLQKKPIPRNDFKKETITAVRRFQHGYCAYPGCKKRNRLQKDHIRGRDDNSFENCQLLCPDHHDLKTRIDKKKAIIGKRLRKAEKIKKR